jgi:hypothetical protein
VKLLFVLLMSALTTAVACKAPSSGHASAAWGGLLRSTPAGGEEHAVTVVSDLELKPYLPQRVLGRLGGSPQGSVWRMGPRSLSEVRRDYPGTDGETELKLADARFEPHATEVIRTKADDATVDDGDLHRLVLPGAVGYSLYDDDQRVAQAQVVIGGRFIATATVQQAQSAQVAVAALSTLDTLALSRLAQSN